VTCPACQRRLRFDAVTPERSAQTVVYPLSIDGVIQHPAGEEPWEYSVLVEVYDGQGEMLSKRVVGVGVVRPGEARRFTLRVEMHVPEPSTSTAASSRRTGIE
jgi:hypothetical protein